MIISDIDLSTQTDIPDTDLVIIVGKNNSGKSRLLKKWSSFFAEKSDYIPPNRFNVADRVSADIDTDRENERQRRTYTFYYGNPSQKVSEYPQPDTFLELIALDDIDKESLKKWHNNYFDTLEIKKKSPTNSDSNTVILIGNKEARTAGSGSRSVLGLLSRLFDPKLDYIFIDEPEIGLEPRVQKILFELIKKFSKGEDNLKKKKIVLATHSNLFLDKEDIKNNWRMEKSEDENVILTQVNTEAELLSTSFNLLGASPADLFFPNNILIVEGLSDQKFISKILELKYPKSKISVHFSDGITKISYAIPAIDQMLKSLTYLSLYKDKICVLIDQDGIPPVLSNWRSYLGDTNNDRIVELGKNGIEYFYPRTILSFLTGVQESELDTTIQLYLENEKSNHENKADFGSLMQITKVELSEKVAEQITATKLPEIDSKIIDLIDKCFTLKIS